MDKPYLLLNNQRRLICHKTKSNQSIIANNTFFKKKSFKRAFFNILQQ